MLPLHLLLITSATHHSNLPPYQSHHRTEGSALYFCIIPNCQCTNSMVTPTAVTPTTAAGAASAAGAPTNRCCQRSVRCHPGTCCWHSVCCPVPAATYRQRTNRMATLPSHQPGAAAGAPPAAIMATVRCWRHPTHYLVPAVSSESASAPLLPPLARVLDDSSDPWLMAASPVGSKSNHGVGQPVSIPQCGKAQMMKSKQFVGSEWCLLHLIGGGGQPSSKRVCAALTRSAQSAGRMDFIGALGTSGCAVARERYSGSALEDKAHMGALQARAHPRARVPTYPTTHTSCLPSRHPTQTHTNAHTHTHAHAHTRTQTCTHARAYAHPTTTLPPQTRMTESLPTPAATFAAMASSLLPPPPPCLF